jgi:hypothetical protein
MMKLSIIPTMLLLLLSTVVLQAQAPVFTPFEGRIQAEQATVIENLSQRASTQRLRLVTLPANAFDAALLELNLFQDVSFLIEQQDIGITGIRAQSWTGFDPDTETTAAFVIHGNRVSGQITSPSGSFELFPIGNSGMHALVENDPAGFDPCGNHSDRSHRRNQLPRIDDIGTYSTNRIVGDECRVRVLVGYTDMAQTQTMADFGRTMIEHIQLAVVNANQSYANSDVDQRTELAYLYNVTDDESSDPDDDVDDLQDDGDSRWNEIHTLRNTYDGDMVGLVVGEVYDIAGKAFGFDYTDPDNMFQVSEYDDATGNFTLYHEFGHTQGLRHDNDNTEDPFEYAHGFNEGTNFRTIMAVLDPVPRVNYWSNPDIDFPGPGGAMGTDDFNDCARALDEGEDDVIGHRLTPATITLVDEINDDEYVDMVATETISATDFVVEDGGQGILRAGENVRLLDGFYATSDSIFYAYIDSGCDLGSGGFGVAEAEEVEVPNQLELQLFPNPAKSQSTLQFTLEEPAEVTVFLTDPFGKQLQSLHQTQRMEAGPQQLEMQVSALPAGIYWCTLVAGQQRQSERLVIIR